MNEHTFSTSGSTGAPRQWVRTVSQMELEASLVYRCWAPDVEEIISFAPTSHSYGMILGQVGAQVTNARLQVCSLERQQLPVLDGVGTCVILAIASTWRLLPSLLPRLSLQRSVLVVHSSSQLPPNALTTVRQYASPRVRFVELLGSTETGAIASRELGADSKEGQVWTLLEDVQLRTPINQQAQLDISSPRIAREKGQSAPAENHICDDLVQPFSNRQFHWLGRVSSLIKVNGKRIDLTWLSSELSERLNCPELVCVPLRDHLRAEAFEVIFSSTTLTEEDILCSLADLVPISPRPTRIRHVQHLPRSATGKPQPWAATLSTKEFNNA